MLMDGNSESRSQSISLTALFHVFFSLLWQAGKYWKAEKAQERKRPAAYALALVCVVSMLAGMLIGNGVGHDVHVYSLE